MRTKKEFPFSVAYTVNKKWFKTFYKTIKEAKRLMNICTKNNELCFITDRKSKKIIDSNFENPTDIK